MAGEITAECEFHEQELGLYGFREEIERFKERGEVVAAEFNGGCESFSGFDAEFGDQQKRWI